jgi:hypothetical protein
MPWLLLTRKTTVLGMEGGGKRGRAASALNTRPGCCLQADIFLLCFKVQRHPLCVELPESVHSVFSQVSCNLRESNFFTPWRLRLPFWSSDYPAVMASFIFVKDLLKPYTCFLMVLYAIVGAMKHDPETTAMITECATRARNRLLKLLEASRQENGDAYYYEKIKDELGRLRVAHRALSRQIESSEVMHMCTTFSRPQCAS